MIAGIVKFLLFLLFFDIIANIVFLCSNSSTHKPLIKNARRVNAAYDCMVAIHDGLKAYSKDANHVVENSALFDSIIYSSGKYNFYKETFEKSSASAERISKILKKPISWWWQGLKEHNMNKLEFMKTIVRDEDLSNFAAFHDVVGCLDSIAEELEANHQIKEGTFKRLKNEKE